MLIKQTEKTLLEQMQIGDFEIEQRKTLFSLTDADIAALKSAKPIIDANIDDLVSKFYELQTSIPEISLLIGDADTLNRLRHAQRKYVVDLFYGLYDLEYVNNRLRIGLVHKRIGVEPKLYLSAMYALKSLLYDLLTHEIQDLGQREEVLAALEKLLLFDISLVFDTYIRSLLSEIEISKEKSDQYAQDLEYKIKERTRQLEYLSRTDPLTGLLNMRHLVDILTGTLRAAQRRAEPVSLVYIDIDDFKALNDTRGHQYGDEVLRILGASIAKVSRKEDSCFRYGGDEFCIILPNCTEDAALELYKLRLSEEVLDKSKEIVLSIGIVQTGPLEYLEPEALITKADRRMYKAKQAKKSSLKNTDMNTLRYDPSGSSSKEYNDNKVRDKK